jgi:hypothetical protein
MRKFERPIAAAPMTSQPPRPIVFISYAHLDEPEKPTDREDQWLSFVISFLRPAERRGVLEIWSDYLMPGGADWDPEIERNTKGSAG